MKGVLAGYSISMVSFFYRRTHPKHLFLSLTLIKQQDVNPAALEEALRRTVTPETVKMKNMKFTVRSYDEKKVWLTPDYRTVSLMNPTTGRTAEVGMTAGLTLQDFTDGRVPVKDSYWWPFHLAGYHGKASLDISFSHLVDGSDPLDKWYWFVRDPQCMSESLTSLSFPYISEEACSRIGSYCQKPLTDRELLPDFAKALEKQFDFIDPLTTRRADWYAEILSSLKEFRGILDPALHPYNRRSVLFTAGGLLAKVFWESYKEDIGRWEAAGGDDLLK